MRKRKLQRLKDTVRERGHEVQESAAGTRGCGQGGRVAEGVAGGSGGYVCELDIYIGP